MRYNTGISARGVYTFPFSYGPRAYYVLTLGVNEYYKYIVNLAHDQSRLIFK